MIETVHSLEEYERKRDTSSALLVYYTSPDCGVCGSIKPKIIAMLETMPSVESIGVDISAHPEISAQNSIFSIPAVVVYFQGRETIREARYFSVDLLKEKMERYLSLL